MELDRRSKAFLLASGFCILWAVLSFSQQSASNVPTNFKLDMETAARLRPQLVAASVPADGPYATGRQVLAKLLAQADRPAEVKVVWELRIVEDGQLNAYASPDGTVYVESGLAKLAGASAGLWAAILSHEIAHVMGRDWARRYLYQRSLESGNAAIIVLGDSGSSSGSWSDSQKASADLGRFCRQLEVDADREGLNLMARAGYHPDFMPALHHLLHAAQSRGATQSMYAMHPCWEERDRELSAAYVAASIEFDRRWPERYASPGGNPPIVVFADEPRVRRMGGSYWEIQVPLRCQNLAGAVEVVLRGISGHLSPIGNLSEALEADGDARQLTGCTSPKTTITFMVSNAGDGQPHNSEWTDVYVLDSWGAILARADLPKLTR